LFCRTSNRLSLHSSSFFNDTAPPEIYPLSLHDALPISGLGGSEGAEQTPSRQRAAAGGLRGQDARTPVDPQPGRRGHAPPCRRRSEEHTSELQSLTNLVCRLLLEKKKQKKSSQQYAKTT